MLAVFRDEVKLLRWSCRPCSDAPYGKRNQDAYCRELRKEYGKESEHLDHDADRDGSVWSPLINGEAAKS